MKIKYTISFEYGTPLKVIYDFMKEESYLGREPTAIDIADSEIKVSYEIVSED